MALKLRLAKSSDRQTLLRLMRQYYAFDGHRFIKRAASAALSQFLADPSLGRAWLVFDQKPSHSAAVGYIVLTLGYSLEFHGRDAFLDEFFLLATHRRRGWGSQILAQVEDAARGLGVQAIHLEAVRGNRGAQAFYRKAGYALRTHHLLTKKLMRSKKKRSPKKKAQ